MAIEVFAVEDTTAQITWVDLPPGPHMLAAGPASAVVEGVAGAVVLDGLDPSTTYDLTLARDGGPAQLVGSLTTLDPPPGRLLFRFATVNDIHIGEHGGHPPFFAEDPYPRPAGLEPYPLRCARAALAEATEWGAELLVAKGDLTRASSPLEFSEAAELLTSFGVPAEAVLGNHDVVDPAFDGPGALAGHGVSIALDPWKRDVPGLRLIFGQTSLAHRKRGGISETHALAMAGLAGEAEGPCFVLIHHQLQRWAHAVYYPPGVPGPEARRFTTALAAANRDTLVASGHTHRTRSYRSGPLTAVEIGSTKDFPGVWAGYAVHEGGIRQVVRRVAAPQALAWTERSRHGLLGIWKRWAPGTLAQRCFSLRWQGRG